MIELGISKEKFDEALKRHEQAFEKELDQISTDEKELRKMLLKMKKAMIEQMRQNNSTYFHASDAVQSISSMNRRMDGFKDDINELRDDLKKATTAFAESIKLLRELEEQKEKEISKPNIFIRFWKFITCQTR
mgnify:CR=1 FL=1